MALAYGQEDFKSVYSPQREISLFERMEETGNVTFVLKRNFRARRHAAEFVIEAFYGRDMIIVHRQATEATKSFSDWAKTTFGARSNTFMLRTRGANETPVGFSFNNRFNANFVIQTIIQLYRDGKILNADDIQNSAFPVRRGSVLIITSYKAQKNMYQGLLEQVNEAEMPKELVDVRTIDESPSFEADVVFACLVRTGKRIGHINDDKRLNVCMSRAKVGAAIFGPGRDVDCTRAPFSLLIEHLGERQSIININNKVDFSIMCENCIQPGHNASKCPHTPHCVRCNERHATRHCPRAEEDAISHYEQDRITADDGIKRNIRANTAMIMSDLKRDKGNKGRGGRVKPRIEKDDNPRAFKEAWDVFNAKPMVDN
ncbi:hypothetical protein H9Q74_005521 [Fusarium xylarioides]|nr:hypothetical protein H9Q71_001857 [Fusarium xylarioides]KAG5824381.1 hypothetical protein H9Q74_005521 [Fusarium xylarioides]